MTLLGRYEKPGMELTICGLPSPQWFEGLDNGEIAEGQGGLTEGQMMWLALHREQRAQQDSETPEPQAEPVKVETEPSGLTPRAVRRRSSRTARQFDLEDTGEL